jgi:predicted nucleic acid-binding protein
VKWGLDTTVIVRLLSGEPADQAEIARKTIAGLRAAAEIPMVDDLAVAEAYFALCYHYRIPKADVLAALRRLLTSGDVIATGVASEILKIENLAAAKPGFVDRVIHALYQERNTTLITFEKASAKLPGVRVLRVG